jgi:NAD(P)H-dependent FMN reductase
MSKTITILTGSMRPNSVGDKLLPLIRQELESREGVNVQVADVREMNLPFVDTPVIPSADDYSPNHDNVTAWQKMVKDSDAVILLAPEYNHQPTAAQKNAIDWLYADWKDMPMAIISYGWGGGQASAELLVKLIKQVQARPLDASASLFFTKDIALDGQILDENRVKSQIASVVEAVMAADTVAVA